MHGVAARVERLDRADATPALEQLTPERIAAAVAIAIHASVETVTEPTAAAGTVAATLAGSGAAATAGTLRRRHQFERGHRADQRVDAGGLLLGRNHQVLHRFGLVAGRRR